MRDKVWETYLSYLDFSRETRLRYYDSRDGTVDYEARTWDDLLLQKLFLPVVAP
jgi:hypothetical protein